MISASDLFECLIELRGAFVSGFQVGLHCPHCSQNGELPYSQHVPRPLPILCRRQRRQYERSLKNYNVPFPLQPFPFCNLNREGD